MANGMAGRLMSRILFLALLAAVAGRLHIEQQPMTSNIDQESGLIEKLLHAEIIPTVLDVFHPKISVEITWKHAQASLGNDITLKKLQKAPSVEFKAIEQSPNPKTPQLTLALTDPDAPSRSNPEWSQVCHWIATQNITSSSRALVDVVPYKAPGPPPKMGKHRYIFVVLAPLNGTTEGLEGLNGPEERKHWEGVRAWAERMGLGVIGANFIYARSDKQRWAF